jgi:hypothetical protein
MAGLRAYATIAALAAVGAAVPAAAVAAVPGGNLLRNGDAQSGVGSGDSSTTAPVPVPAWTTTTAFTEHLYQTAGSFPGPDASAAIAGGTQFFAGGPNAADTETATQDVDVSAASSEIDAGAVRATLSAALGGYETQEDNARVSATFLGAAGQALGTVAIGPVTAGDRDGATKLLPRASTATVPAATRSVHVVITATRTEGAYNDGYADNVSLVLAAAAAAPPDATPRKTIPLRMPRQRRCSGHRFTIRLHRPHGSRIVGVVATVRGRRVAHRHGHSITRLTIRRAPRGRFVLRVAARRSDGARMIGRHTYRGCA